MIDRRLIWAIVEIYNVSFGPYNVILQNFSPYLNKKFLHIILYIKCDIPFFSMIEVIFL